MLIERVVTYKKEEKENGERGSSKTALGGNQWWSSEKDSVITFRGRFVTKSETSGRSRKVDWTPFVCPSLMELT